MAVWGEFSSKYYSRQILNLGTNVYKIWKNKSHFDVLILKVDVTKVHLFFLILYSLLPKIEVCLIQFLDENSPKTTLVC